MLLYLFWNASPTKTPFPRVKTKMSGKILITQRWLGTANSLKNCVLAATAELHSHLSTGCSCVLTAAAELHTCCCVLSAPAELQSRPAPLLMT